MSWVLADVANDGALYVPPTATWADLIASFDADSNTYYAWDAAAGVTTAGGSVSTWEDQIGAADFTTPAADPTNDLDDGGYASVVHTSNDRLLQSITFSGSWGLCIRARRDNSNDCTPISISDAAESAVGRANLYVTNTDARIAINPDTGTDDAAIDTLTVGTGFRVYFLTFDGSTYRLRVDSRTAVTVGTPGAITATRLVVGALIQAASVLFQQSGANSHVAAVNGRTWTTGEEDEMVAHLGAL